jgi:hypothetical protein
VEQLSNWTLEAIRADSPMMTWLEERRFDWVPAVYSALTHLMRGAAIVIVTDREREWFADYLSATLNKSDRKRPLLPVFNAKELMPHLDRGGGDETALVEDMLSIAFHDRFIYWYIGRGDDARAHAPKKRNDSFTWVMDEEVQNGFFLRSADLALDIKLMHLARLFNKTIEAAMFGEVNLQ